MVALHVTALANEHALQYTHTCGVPRNIGAPLRAESLA